MIGRNYWNSSKGDPVYASEFKYIYEKNNRDNADYSKESLEEYLNLYINFKLKVRKAKEKKYDQSPQYKEELAGYRRQLADSYVIDKEVIDRIVDQIYERQRYDVGLQHILSALPAKAPDDRVRKEYDEIVNTAKVIKEGLSFEDAVERFSEDPNSASLEGDIGYVTTTLPDGYVQLEDEAYRLKVGEISGPIRTDLGWHLIKLRDKRPARGTMEVAHILLRKERNGIPLAAVDSKLNSIKAKIEAGELTFAEAAKRNSEDAKTSREGGYLGFFGIGEYEAEFEATAFGLSEDGKLSVPVETSIGWHLIKRISKRAPADKKALKARVKSQMSSGVRFDKIKAEVVENLQQEAKFKENIKALDVFVDSLDMDFFDYNWKRPKYPKLELQSYEGDTYTIQDLAAFAKQSGKLRLKAKGQRSPQELALEVYREFTNNNAIAYAESRLEERYADFRNLMREYEEGILLFEITKDNVWDMAAKDTTGLKAYFEDHKYEYKWKKRAKLVSYSLRTVDPNLVAKILNDSRTLTATGLASKYNTPEKELVMYNEEVLESGSKSLEGMVIAKGSISTPTINNGLKISTFKKIDDVIEPAPKTLKEAKGYIISDYQDVLEQQWIEELKKAYKVSLKKKTLKSLIKK